MHHPPNAMPTGQPAYLTTAAPTGVVAANGIMLSQAPIMMSNSYGMQFVTGISPPPSYQGAQNAMYGGPTAGVAPIALQTTTLTTSLARTYQNLKVGGLPLEVDDSDLHAIFESFGKIESAKVMLNVNTGESRGFGFVLFDQPDSGNRAFNELNGKTLTVRDKSFTLDVKSSDWDGSQAAMETNSIYVRNIPNCTTDEELRAMFSRFGTVVSLTTRLQHHAAAAAAHVAATAAMGGATPNVSFARTPNHTTVDGVMPSGSHGDALLGVSVDSLSASVPGVSMSPSASNELNKLASIEFDSVDSARKAIAETHRQLVFPLSGTVPALAKFADPPQLKESKRHMKKQQQQAAQQAHVQAQLHNAVVVGNAPPAYPNGTMGFPAASHITVGPPRGLTAPSQPSVLPHHAYFMPTTSGSNTMPAPTSTTTSNRFPDAVPLPLNPREGAQRIYYQGLLGISTDGQLYPIRPETCFYVDQHTTTAAAYPQIPAQLQQQLQSFAAANTTTLPNTTPTPTQMFGGQSVDSALRQQQVSLWNEATHAQSAPSQMFFASPPPAQQRPATIPSNPTIMFPTYMAGNAADGQTYYVIQPSTMTSTPHAQHSMVAATPLPSCHSSKANASDAVVET